MYYLVYISTAIKLMNDEELKEVLAVSRKKNKAQNITGILLYSEGTFIQLLEGDEKNVEETYRHIESDPRHKNLIKLITGEADQRSFPGWAMAFAAADKELTKELEAYIAPSKSGFLPVDEQNPALSILRTFAENNKLG